MSFCFKTTDMRLLILVCIIGINSFKEKSCLSYILYLGVSLLLGLAIVSSVTKCPLCNTISDVGFFSEKLIC